MGQAMFSDARLRELWGPELTNLWDPGHPLSNAVQPKKRTAKCLQQIKRSMARTIESLKEEALAVRAPPSSLQHSHHDDMDNRDPDFEKGASLDVEMARSTGRPDQKPPLDAPGLQPTRRR